MALDSNNLNSLLEHVDHLTTNSGAAELWETGVLPPLSPEPPYRQQPWQDRHHSHHHHQQPSSAITSSSPPVVLRSFGIQVEPPVVVNRASGPSSHTSMGVILGESSRSRTTQTEIIGGEEYQQAVTDEIMKSIQDSLFAPRGGNNGAHSNSFWKTVIDTLENQGSTTVAKFDSLFDRFSTFATTCEDALQRQAAVILGLRREIKERWRPLVIRLEDSVAELTKELEDSTTKVEELALKYSDEFAELKARYQRDSEEREHALREEHSEATLHLVNSREAAMQEVAQLNGLVEELYSTMASLQEEVTTSRKVLETRHSDKSSSVSKGFDVASKENQSDPSSDDAEEGSSLAYFEGMISPDELRRIVETTKHPNRRMASNSPSKVGGEAGKRKHDSLSTKGRRSEGKNENPFGQAEADRQLLQQLLFECDAALSA